MTLCPYKVGLLCPGWLGVGFEHTCLKIKLDNYVRHGIMCIYIHISFDTLRKWFVMVTERAFEGGDKNN